LIAMTQARTSHRLPGGISPRVVVFGDNQICRKRWEASVAELNVNPGDLLRVADAYTELAARAALVSPQAVTAVQQIAGTHGVMGYPCAVGVVAGLAKAEGPLQAKIGDFTTYAQRFTVHAGVYTTTDADGAAAFDALNFGDADGPKDPNDHVQAADFEKNHAPAPLGPFDEIRKIPHWTDKDLYPYEPSAADIHQDAIGDCYLAATMGAVANANPQWIKDRIHYNEHTTDFDVTLWNGHEWQKISVTQHDIQTNIDHHGASWLDNGSPHAPLWPSVLEDAYAKMNHPNDDLGHALDAGIGQAGNAHDAMQALTGNRGVTIDPEKVWWTREHIDQNITQALTNHQPVTISTTTDASMPLVAPHTYIVEGITGSGSDAQLTLRNPWEGNPGDMKNPIVTVRLGDLIGSGPTGKFDDFGTHPMSNVNIGELGK